MKKLISIYFGVLILPMLCIFLLPQREFSELENRNLADLPKCDLQSILTTQWMDDFEDALKDQFPIREFGIKLKSSMEYAAGRRDIKSAYIGNRLFEKRKDIDSNLMRKNANAAKILMEYCQLNGIEFSFLPAFSAHEIYPNELPAYAPVIDERAIFEGLTQMLGNKIINTFPKEPSENDYFKMDHHWTQNGAYDAYASYCNAKGIKEALLSELKANKQSGFFGSLYSRVPLLWYEAEEFNYWDLPPCIAYYDDEKDPHGLYDIENLQKKDKYALFLYGNHAVTRIKSSTKNGQKLMIFKDSFAHALIPFLTLHYEEIIAYDLRYYKRNIKGLIQEEKPQEVMLCYNVSWFASDEYIKDLI